VYVLDRDVSGLQTSVRRIEQDPVSPNYNHVSTIQTTSDNPWMGAFHPVTGEWFHNRAGTIFGEGGSGLVVGSRGGGFLGFDFDSTGSFLYAVYNLNNGGWPQARLVKINTTTWIDVWTTNIAGASSGVNLDGLFTAAYDVAVDDVRGRVYVSEQGPDTGVVYRNIADGSWDSGNPRWAVPGPWFQGGPWFLDMPDADTLITTSDYEWIGYKANLTSGWAPSSCTFPYGGAKPTGFAPTGVTVVDGRIWVADRTVIYMATGGGWKVGSIAFG
jgi:hypothetical protein